MKDETKRDKGEDPFASRRRDSEGVKLWRQRMGTAEAKAIYKERAATAEWDNAGARNRGCYAVGVRGRRKVLAVALRSRSELVMSLRRRRVYFPA